MPAAHLVVRAVPGASRAASRVHGAATRARRAAACMPRAAPWGHWAVPARHSIAKHRIAPCGSLSFRNAHPMGERPLWDGGGIAICVWNPPRDPQGGEWRDTSLGLRALHPLFHRGAGPHA